MNRHSALEQTSHEALKLYEKGKPISEILNLFPKFRKELEEVFKTIEILGVERERIVPPKEALVKIVSSLPGQERVTKKDLPRFSLVKGGMGFSVALSWLERSLVPTHRNWLVGLTTVFLFIAGGIYWYLGQRPYEYEVISPVKTARKEIRSEKPSEVNNVPVQIQEPPAPLIKKEDIASKNENVVSEPGEKSVSLQPKTKKEIGQQNIALPVQEPTAAVSARPPSDNLSRILGLLEEGASGSDLLPEAESTLLEEEPSAYEDEQFNDI